MDLNSYICVVFFCFGREDHDFLLCFDARPALSLFTVNDSCQLPWHVTALNRHAHVRIGQSWGSWETRLSETFTYVLAALQDIRTSFCALIRRRTDYRLRVCGPAATQAIFYCSIRTYFPVALCLYLVIKFICRDIRIWIRAHNPCGFTYRQSVWKLKPFRWSQRSESFYTYSSYSKLLKLHWSYPLLT